MHTPADLIAQIAIRVKTLATVRMLHLGEKTLQVMLPNGIPLEIADPDVIWAEQLADGSTRSPYPSLELIGAVKLAHLDTSRRIPVAIRELDRVPDLKLLEQAELELCTLRELQELFYALPGHGILIAIDNEGGPWTASHGEGDTALVLLGIMLSKLCEQYLQQANLNGKELLHWLADHFTEIEETSPLIHIGKAAVELQVVMNECVTPAASPHYEYQDPDETTAED